VEVAREDTGLVSRLPALGLPARAGRRTNVGLLALLLVAAATGVLAYGVGTPAAARAVTAVHGAAGLALLLLVPWKSVIVRRARRRGLSVVAVGLGLMVALTVVTGVLHAAGVTGSVGRVSVLAVHVGAAVCVLPLLVGHAWGRRQRPRRTDLSRRVLLQSGGVALSAAAVWTAGETLWRVTGVPGARRRATGSLEQGTDNPAGMPVTQWFTDAIRGSVRSTLLLTDGAHSVQVPMNELSRGDAVRATLDCTGGWYAAQDWSGIRLDRLLADRLGSVPPDGSIDVISRTGYRRRLPLGDAPRLLLATSAGGQPLSAGHGAPVRLVAPGRRGFWWVKWVDRLELVDEPWWWQPPFPLH
jgi:hypothetical protein